MAVGRVATLDARDLRLALDESLEILRAGSVHACPSTTPCACTN